MTKVNFAIYWQEFLNQKIIFCDFCIYLGLRILAFPCNQFASQMPEGDGDEMVCHLRDQNAEFGDVFARVRSIHSSKHLFHLFRRISRLKINLFIFFLIDQC